MSVSTVVASIRQLTGEQPLGVLATHDGDQAYASLVAFAAPSDLGRFVFATLAGTRKYANLTRCPRVSLLVDNRSNRPADFREAMAVTLVGAVEPDGECRASTELRGLYLAKHPHLQEFVAAPSCRLLTVRVEACYLVRRFQEVMEYYPQDELRHRS